MKLKVTVTKQHISEAMWCETPNAIGRTDKHCAIALAVRGILPHASVHSTTMYADTSSLCYANRKKILLPENAIKFIDQFDSLTDYPEKRLELPELEFEIGIPTELIDSINIDDIHNSKNIELVV